MYVRVSELPPVLQRQAKRIETRFSFSGYESSFWPSRAGPLRPSPRRSGFLAENARSEFIAQ